jgi:hypothetical protein
MQNVPQLHHLCVETDTGVQKRGDGTTAYADLPALAGRAGVPNAGNVEGPFTLTHATSGIDTGVALWTPAVGDHIVGLWIELTEAFDAADEKLGIGYAGTIDADLAFQFPLSMLTPPAAHATFDRGQGVGFSQLTEVVRIKHTTPLVARTLVGGNTTGALQVSFVTIPAA